MCCSSNNLIGYHGTSRESAKAIVKTNCFHKSQQDNEWAGSGIYFFIDGYTCSSAANNASQYATKVKRLCDVVVLKVDINTAGLRIFDLTNPYDQQKFTKCFELLWNEAFHRFGDVGLKAVKAYRHHVLECRAINEICTCMGYEAVIRSDFINFNQTCNHSHPYSTIPNCTMFCLRSDKYILNIDFL